VLIDTAISGDINVTKKDVTIEIEGMWSVKTKARFQ
jgi:hypothetical protein